MSFRSARFVALALALIAPATLAACGDDGERTLLERARDDGITIGIANERPYGFEEDGRAVGEAPALATEIFDRMGIDDISFEVVDFGALIAGLNADRYDVIAAGMFVTPERAEQVAFADPDYCATTAFAVPTPNPRELRDFSTVTSTGTRLGVLSGAVEEEYASRSGVPASQVESFPTTPDLFDALRTGRVDAVALTSITVRDQVSALDGFEATPGFVPVIDGEEQLGCGAFAFRQDDRAFRDAFNVELAAMQDAGEVLGFIAPYGFTDAEVDAAKGVTAADLSG
jgi:polar amino acid transport system substrate-binding protein